jgi:hypothetical protein
MLALALLHRAESLMSATGAMLEAKNVYGLALVARGYVEATAVLGYFCKRVDALTKGNIDFERFEKDIANGLLGAKHDLFSKADSPVNVLTCVEQADKYLDVNLFGGEKKGMLQDIYGWLSEFAHPNVASGPRGGACARTALRLQDRSRSRCAGWIAMTTQVKVSRPNAHNKKLSSQCARLDSTPIRIMADYGILSAIGVRQPQPSNEYRPVRQPRTQRGIRV